MKEDEVPISEAVETSQSNTSEVKKAMTEEERMELAAKLDKDLDEFIAGLEKRSYTEGWPEDRWEEEMEKHPFFMKKLPEDGEMSPLMQGLQQLKYDENENTPLELATSYKEDGNFNFKCKKYRMAIISYSEGLRANCGDDVLEGQLYGNRAAAQFFLGNYRSSLNDCLKALKKDPKHGKAKMRAAQCYLKLKKFPEVIDFCDDMLESAPEDQSVIKLRAQAVAGQKLEERNQRRRECVDKILQAEREALKSALEIRKIKLNIDEEDILESLKVADPKPVLEDHVISWPVYFLYPEHSISDYIERFNETATFKEHLEEMFVVPPPWDPTYEYRPEDITIYYEGYDKSKLYQVDQRETLGDVLSCGRYYVRDWKPSFLILVRGSRAEANFLKNYTLMPIE